MRLLLIGSGGVGQSIAAIIKRSGEEGKWLEKMVISDYNLDRAKEVANLINDQRFVPAQVDASSSDSIKKLVKEHNIDFIMNAVEPAFNQSIFDTAFEVGVGYMDCAMTLSYKHPEKPYELPHVKLGDYQFARHEQWKKKGTMALVGSGVEPGMANVFAKYAAKYLFDEIDEVNIRDGDNYVIPGRDIAFGFNIWSTIEECLNPPVIWEKGRGWFCTEPFSEPEIFSFPCGIGDIEVVNVEHEEVMLVPRVIDCKRVTFKYGLPKDFRVMLKNVEALGMDSAVKKIKVGNSEITPRDFLIKVAPSPLETAKIMEGIGTAGTWVTGKKDGLNRSVYLYSVADNQECFKKYGTSSIVAQTAVGPVIMLELIAKGIWSLPGVHGPESFEPEPFVKRLAAYEFPAGLMEKDSEYQRKIEEKNILATLATA